MLHDLPQYRDREEVFEDRVAAGRVLASMLEAYRGTDAIVLAIPAGGVPVAVEIARVLELPLDVAVVSKITLPWNTEAGYGAVAWEGTTMLNHDMRFYFLLTDEAVNEGTMRATDKVRHRVADLRGDHPFPDLSQRTAILVDDGLASGFTVRVAVKALRNLGAQRIILAVPTALRRVAEEMEAFAEEVYCPNLRQGQSFAVADAYEHWRDVNEHEAKELLESLHPVS